MHDFGLELPTLWDVDRPEDYARLSREGLLDKVEVHCELDPHRCLEPQRGRIEQLRDTRAAAEWLAETRHLASAVTDQLSLDGIRLMLKLEKLRGVGAAAAASIPRSPVGSSGTNRLWPAGGSAL